MARRIERTIRFDSTASRAKNAFVLVYDLEGFSRFFNQPDVQDYVPKFINRVQEAIGIALFGGSPYWEPEGEIYEPLLAPIHEKFLGDGALFVWTPPKGEKTFSEDFAVRICNRLWNVKNFFPQILRKCADDVPVLELPQRIRFGVARGTVYELTRTRSNKKEYIGFCINLASRLQKYCPDLGFIASARIGLPEATLEKHGYTRVVASKLRGFPKEIVIVDKKEFERLDEAVRSELFESL